jgi:hypothetical protein
MSEKTVNETPPSNETPTTSSRPPMARALSTPSTPTSPLATNPWYRQKFEFVCLRSIYLVILLQI